MLLEIILDSLEDPIHIAELLGYNSLFREQNDQLVIMKLMHILLHSFHKNTVSKWLEIWFNLRYRWVLKATHIWTFQIRFSASKRMQCSLSRFSLLHWCKFSATDIELNHIFMNLQIVDCYDFIVFYLYMRAFRFGISPSSQSRIIHWRKDFFIAEV